jgi:hypothetical protein
MFRRDLSHPYPGLKSKPSKKAAWSRQEAQFHDGFFLDIHFSPEDRDDTFLRNIG